MKYYYSFLALFAAVSLFGQRANTQSDHRICGQHVMTEAFFASHPEAVEPAAEARAALDLFTQNYAESVNRGGGDDDDVLIIPVVFHVFQPTETETVTDEQIHVAMDILNEDFSANNPDLSSVAPEFQDIIANVGFEFRLAKRDPEGICITGIDRVISGQLLTSYDAVSQAVPAWDRSSYLNIWVMNQAPGILIGATNPSDVVDNPDGDGIFTIPEYIGSSSWPFVLTHCVGHWADLDHIWGHNNTKGLASNCDIDDGVDDTPNTIGQSTCDLTASSCGSLDNVQNFMDTWTCNVMFTAGQKTRMRAALNSSISGRNQIWTPENLEATGVLEPDEICRADFKATGLKSICPGQSVQFMDQSLYNPTAWEWIFEGGDPASSTLENPEVVFNQPGSYTVSLTASDSSGSASITKTAFVTVIDSADMAVPFTEGFENFSSLVDNDQNWTVINPDSNTVHWELTDIAASSGTKSIRVRGRLDQNFGVQDLLSPTFDLSEMSDDVTLSFDYAHRLRSEESIDELIIFVSNDCGEHWHNWLELSNEDLSTVPGFYEGEFSPVTPDEWSEIEIDDIMDFLLTGSFRFKLRFSAISGNDFYVDNIRLFDPNALGIEQVEILNYMKVYPNPAQSEFTFECSLKSGANVKISMIDITGRIVLSPISKNWVSGKQKVRINTAELSPGIYFLTIESKGQRAVSKVVLE